MNGFLSWSIGGGEGGREGVGEVCVVYIYIYFFRLFKNFEFAEKAFLVLRREIEKERKKEKQK